MSDDIKHECGVAMIRLLKPLSFYKKKYNTARYALNKMYLLMQKQVNRGQDGAGLANIKLNVPPGKRYISRYRTNLQNPVREVFKYIDDKLAEELAEKYGTPLQVYDEDLIRNNTRNFFKKMRNNLKNFQQFYAVKALPNPAILKILLDEGCYLDCSSTS